MCEGETNDAKRIFAQGCFRATHRLFRVWKEHVRFCKQKFIQIQKMTNSLEIVLISDDNDQLNSVAVWDIKNGTQLMQYRGKYLNGKKY